MKRNASTTPPTTPRHSLTNPPSAANATWWTARIAAESPKQWIALLERHVPHELQEAVRAELRIEADRIRCLARHIERRHSPFSDPAENEDAS
jgi:hypothetical protein